MHFIRKSAGLSLRHLKKFCLSLSSSLYVQFKPKTEASAVRIPLPPNSSTQEVILFGSSSNIEALKITCQFEQASKIYKDVQFKNHNALTYAKECVVFLNYHKVFLYKISLYPYKVVRFFGGYMYLLLNLVPHVFCCNPLD